MLLGSWAISEHDPPPLNKKAALINHMQSIMLVDTGQPDFYSQLTHPSYEAPAKPLPQGSFFLLYSA